jgi:hypothetical protein
MNRDDYIDKINMTRVTDLSTKISVILGGVPSIEALLCMVNLLCLSSILYRKKGASEEDILDSIHQCVEHIMRMRWSELVGKEK